MVTDQPRLEVAGPDGQRFVAPLTMNGRTRIGRLAAFVDIVLTPDPQSLVSKQHCIVENELGMWWLTDNSSTNGTYVRHGKGGPIERVYGRVALKDGDAVCIVGLLSETSAPEYWQLSFRDPLKTVPVDLPDPTHAGSAQPCIEYEWVEGRLYRLTGEQRVDIPNLRWQAQKLVRYMAEKNRQYGNMAALCEYDEIIKAVWGDDAYQGQDAVNHLVYELRQKIELDPKTPQILETERGLGYRLHTCSRSPTARRGTGG